jgi:two-component system, cell cycle sensor histidine kinase and response regulator CckA
MSVSGSITVLLVEDNAVDARLVEGLLTHAGAGQFSITRAITLAEALSCLSRGDIGLVILDLNLPDSTGLETLQRVLARNSHAAIVVLTGTDEEVGIQAMREGAQDYIPKGQLQAPLLARSVRYAIERHRASQALRESNESLARVISSAADAIVTKDLKGIIRSWNPAAERMFGYSADEVLGKPLPMIFPVDRVNEEREILARIQKGESVEHFESIRIRKDGRPLQVALTISPIRDSEGRVIGASKIARDISAQKQAEEALRKSERQLRQFIEQAPVSVAMFDMAMRYVAASRRWVEAYGRGHSELVGLGHYDLNPDLPERWKELHRRGLAGENLRNDRDVWLKDNGEQHWLRWAINPWHCSSGDIGGVIILADDITEQVQAEEELRFHENLLRETGHIAKVGGWEFDVGTGAGYWTEEVAHIHELDHATQPFKENGLTFYQGESRSKIERALTETIERGIPYDLELELTTAKGNRRWIRTIGHPVFENEKVAKVRGSFQDITERRLAEDQLRRQASLLDQAFDAVFVWERGGAITFWNQGAEKMYGFSKQEAVGRITHKLLQTSAPQVLEDALQSLSLKGSWAGELGHTRQDGKRIVVESRMVQISEGDRHYVLETNRDVSEKRLLEEQLRQSQKMEGIGRLAGGVAHDFNNLLGVILGSAELLVEAADLNQVRKRAEEIRKAGQRAANLTRQLLAFSRKQMLEPKVIDLNSKISEMTNMLMRLVGEDIEISTSLPANLGKVRTDPSQIEQILLNLVVNARDAMPNGGKITIETQNIDLAESYVVSHTAVLPGPYVMIAISDSGMGIDAETLAHIFEPFFTTKLSGTGLGLAMVYGAVKQSGGNIWVYSEPGKGTTFKIYFPRVDGAADSAEAAERNAVTPKGSETILLVEDSDSLREVTREFLQIAGYNVVEGRDGKDALQVAQTHEEAIHLLLTDVVMPGMSGRELANEIKRIHPETRILFMSGYTSNAIVHRGVLDEGVSLLPKPFTRSALTQKVREILNLSSV